MWSPLIRPTRIELDLAAATANAGRLTGLLSDPESPEIYAVVKADAYGHGALTMAKAFLESRATSGLAVSLVEEGMELRAGGVTAPILVMGPALDGGYDEIVEYDLTPMVSSRQDLVELHARGEKHDRVVPVHLKVDTGMGRLGFTERELDQIVSWLSERSFLALEGVATHMSAADTDDPGDLSCQTNEQVRRFDTVLGKLGQTTSALVAHAANSAAALRFPSSRYDRVRIGLALYGAGRFDAGFRPVMRLLSAVAQLRSIPSGTTISYGGRFRAPRDLRVAIVPIGYADGYPRRLSGLEPSRTSAEVLIGGQRAPVVGAISMDMTVVDVTSIPVPVEVGDPVVLLGSQGKETVTTHELAERSGLIEYEVTCGISKRVPRMCVSESE